MDERAIIATGTSKAVGEDAVLQNFAERLAHLGSWRVVVTLAVELACAGKFMPSLEMVGNGLAKQRALRMDASPDEPGPDQEYTDVALDAVRKAAIQLTAQGVRHG